MSLSSSLPALRCATLAALGSIALAPAQAQGVEWNARTAEHLLNRAAFGGDPAEIQAAVEAGLEATVERLVRTASGPGVEIGVPPPQLRGGVPLPPVMDDGPDFEEAGPELVVVDAFYVDGGQLRKVARVREYASEWIDSMVAGDDPLRDRMTIFWHGHFVSSFEEVRDGADIVRQLAFLRANALGDFETLVRGIARDPAMLEYLNNDINVKALPNENWARELMELFTLGEGNYSETDIKEAARAFTGWTRRDHAFAFDRDQHDYGLKTVLGVTGNLDGDAVIDILLAEEQCGRFIAEKLITYFEGEAPSEARRDHYAAVLRANDYRVDEFLSTLFLDIEFYRESILGNRVAAPVEYFVGMARRLGAKAPADVLYVTSALSGQQLGAPPNVKGWEEGFSWLTTGLVMQRSNYAGILLGEYDREIEPLGIAKEIVEERGRGFQGPYRDYLSMNAWLRGVRWQPELELRSVLAADLADDEAVRVLLDHLMPVPVAEDTATELGSLVAAMRSESGSNEPLLSEGADELLTQLVHVILSLPEAQML
jgi:uncharacterized protein (DUF1800 family)